MNTTIPVKEKDFLEEDPPIRNQNYVCLSFISPEDILIEKEAYFFSQFLQKFSTDMTELFNNLALKFPDDKSVISAIKDTHNYITDPKQMDEQYKFFKSQYGEDIQKQFDKENNFRTNVRGLKVRGTYDTEQEAKNQINKLKKNDPNFDIYMAQVGCWIPFNPDPNSVKDQEYNETQLNTLMSKYKQNNENRDAMFEERTKNAIKEKEKEEAKGDETSNNTVTATLEVADDDDGSYEPVFPETPSEAMERMNMQ